METDAQPIQSSPYMSPMHNYGSSIITLTSSESVVHILELTLKNIRETDDGQIVPIGSPYKPMMNDLGINSVLGIVQAVLNKVTVFSNFNKQDVELLMNYLNDTLAKDLMINMHKYQIESSQVRDNIKFIVESTAYSCIKRALDEGERRFWRGSVQEIKTTVDTGKRGGILGGLTGGWRK